MWPTTSVTCTAPPSTRGRSSTGCCVRRFRLSAPARSSSSAVRRQRTRTRRPRHHAQRDRARHQPGVPVAARGSVLRPWISTRCAMRGSRQRDVRARGLRSDSRGADFRVRRVDGCAASPRRFAQHSREFQRRPPAALSDHAGGYAFTLYAPADARVAVPVRRPGYAHRARKTTRSDTGGTAIVPLPGAKAFEVLRFRRNG